MATSSIVTADPAAARSIAPEDIAATFGTDCIDLISKPLNSRILSFTDEWFAAASNLTTPTPPIRRPGVFTYAGAWYDGWETRRHNPSPPDAVVIALGVASGRVRGVEIDTAFFDGNHAPEIAVQACATAAGDDAVRDPAFEGWETLLARRACGPNTRQAWALAAESGPVTHVRLLMFPDGGIARFRLFGVVVPVLPADADAVLDLAAAVNGGVAVRCSDQHFGTKDNLLLPGRGVDMGDGWETKRSRGEHVDWVIVRLGLPGVVERVVVDTAHYRGNFPQRVQLFAAGPGEVPAADDGERWVQILAPAKTGPDREHVYEAADLEAVQGRTWAYVKMVIIPDGGVKRIRVFGKRGAL